MLSKFFILSLLAIFSLALPAYAEDFLVEVLEDLDAQNPPQEYSVRAVKDIYVTDFDKIEQGSVIKGQLGKFVPAKRLERDAYLVFVPTSFTIPSEKNKEVVFSSYVKSKIKPNSQINKGEVATNTVGTALSFIPPLNIIIPAIQFVVGVAVSCNDEHPVKSGLRKIVESWPICYCLKGKEISIKAGTQLEISLNEKMFQPAKVSREAI